MSRGDGWLKRGPEDQRAGPWSRTPMGYEFLMLIAFTHAAS
jgi:hypothetical protein